MVAREHAEPARIHRQALVERELHREVRDEELAGGALLVPPGRPLELGLERPLGVADARDEGGVLGRALEAIVREPGEEDDRVVVGLVPVGRVEVAEDLANVRQPREREVPREPFEQAPELVAAHRFVVVRHQGNQAKETPQRGERAQPTSSTAVSSASPPTGT